MSQDLSGKVAIVTGAGRRGGIGAAICRALAARGADVLFTYWKDYDREMPWNADEAGPETLLEELRRAGIRAEGIEVDLSLPDSPEGLLDTAEGQLGPSSILVNNAAHSTQDGFENLDAATLDAHYAVNLRATALLCAGFARRYSGGPGGRIINITSGQSLGPMIGELAYAATKGAVEALTVTLAAEVGHKDITVNAVNPGPTDTGLDDGRAKARTGTEVLWRTGREAGGCGAARGGSGGRGDGLDHGPSHQLRGWIYP